MNKALKVIQSAISFDPIAATYSTVKQYVIDAVAASTKIALILFKVEHVRILNKDGDKVSRISEWGFTQQEFREKLLSDVQEATGNFNLSLASALNLVAPMKYWIGEQGVSELDFLKRAEFFRIGKALHAKLVKDGKTVAASKLRDQIGDAPNQDKLKEFCQNQRISEGYAAKPKDPEIKKEDRIALDGLIDQKILNPSQIEHGTFDSVLIEISVLCQHLIDAVSLRKDVLNVEKSKKSEDVDSTLDPETSVEIIEITEAIEAIAAK
jgi:hypothetical protein